MPDRFWGVSRSGAEGAARIDYQIPEFSIEAQGSWGAKPLPF
jgi:hypothetical protein